MSNVKQSNPITSTTMSYNIRTLDPKAVVAELRDNGVFTTFERFPVLDYSLDNALEVVTAIGKALNPLFAIDGECLFIYENLVKWFHADPSALAIDPVTFQPIPADLNKGFVIAGPTGTGKTLALEVMRAYAMAWDFRVHFPNDPKTKRLIYNHTTNIDEICQQWIVKGEIDEYKRRSILVIEDLGTEQRERLHMGNRLNVLKHLLEYREAQKDRLTFITTNLRIDKPEEIKQALGDRVASRLTKMCNYYYILGGDRRLKQASKAGR